MWPEQVTEACPLLQRLLIHGFATVQMAPWQRLPPQDWRVPGLQALPGRQPVWRRALAACQPYSDYVDAAVISPSWQRLRSTRKRQPNRSLIYCQSPFERPLPARHVRQLCKGNRPAAWWFCADDPQRVLFWLDRLPVPVERIFPPRQQFPVHPWQRCLQTLRQCSSVSDFWPREDGRIVQQMHVFAPWPAPREEPTTRTARATYDRCFTQYLRTLRGHHVVCAKSRRALLWFGRDVQRLGSVNDGSVWAPNWPDRRDPRRLFVLVDDARLRYTALPYYWPILHLDGESRTWRYRAARLPGTGGVAWRSLAQHAFPWADLAQGRHRILCVSLHGRWYGWCGETLRGENATGALWRRLRTLAALNGSRHLPTKPA